MKRIIFILAIIMMIADTADAQQKLNAVKEKTTLSWLGEKVLGEHTGTVELKSGWLHWDNNRITGGEFLVDMTSIKSDENIDRLVGHLKSDDFFGSDNHPVSKLEITESAPFDKGSANVKGNLTIKGITRPVEFKAAIQKNDEGTWFYANIIIDRSEYNIRYGSGSFFDNLGDKTIYDEFKLKISLFAS